MQQGFICKICGSKRHTTIDSYKHKWISCNDCGNVFRLRKERYLMERILPMQFAEKMLPTAAVKQLYPMREVINEEKVFYDYYADVSKMPIEKTKWAYLPSKFDAIFTKYNIDISDKKILDISGGPGYLTQYLKDKCKKAVVTEFSQESVTGMAANLGINAVKYDYNTDLLDDVVKEKFDIVLIEYSLNFCNNLSDFLSRLHNVTSDKAFIHVTFVAPTLGCCLRWQHDEYTYNNLYQPETVIRIFAQNGFTLKDRYSAGQHSYLEGFNSYLEGFNWKLFCLEMPFIYWYKTKALMVMNSINRELIRKSITCIFTKE